MKIILPLFLALSVFCTKLQAQEIIVSGKLTDASTSEPLPFAPVFILGEQIGTTTDFDGNFELVLEKHYDSIVFSYMGYVNAIKPLSKKTKQVFNVVLEEDFASLNEIVIKPGENPAHRIIKAAQKKKSLYDQENYQSYQYESFNRIQLAVDNISDKFKKRKIFSAMEPLFDTISSLSGENSTPVLPVFISESISDYYFNRDPRRTKEIIKGSKVNGVGVGDDSYISQLLGSTFQRYNFNKNNLFILDKNFVSPISSQSLSYYIFILKDSMILDGKKTYKIDVIPRNKRDLVFEGSIWIADESFALKRAVLEITDEANLNFIEKLKIQQDNQEVAPGVWLSVKNRVLIDIAELTENTLGFIGTYYGSNQNFVVNEPKPLNFFHEKVEVLPDATYKDEIFWDSSRHDKLTQSDEKIYLMVDSFKNQPLIKTYVQWVELIIEGYQKVGEGKIELGPYANIINFNQLEGFRFNFGFRTTPKFSNRWKFRAYGAYGLRDERFKYFGSAKYIISQKKWSRVGLQVKDDVELIGVTDQNYGTSILFDALSTFGAINLNRGEEINLWGEFELFKGYTQTISFRKKHYYFYPYGRYNFHYIAGNNNGIPIIRSDFDNTTIQLKGRFSYKELFIIRNLERVSLGNLKAPVVTVNYTKSLPNFGGDFNYQQGSIHLYQSNSFFNLGSYLYHFEIGKTFGKAPYPVLNVMRGNESIASSSTAFNMMNFFEFVADEYAYLQYEHNFDGLLMNRIPLVKDLKLRSFIYTKMAIGSLNSENLDIIPASDNEGRAVTPIGTFRNDIPYIEAAYGLENIFRLFRVEFIHRLTYLDNERARPFFVKGTVVVKF